MAEAKITKRTVEVTLTLDAKEAKALRDLLIKQPDNSDTDDIFYALEKHLSEFANG